MDVNTKASDNIHFNPKYYKLSKKSDKPSHILHNHAITAAQYGNTADLSQQSHNSSQLTSNNIYYTIPSQPCHYQQPTYSTHLEQQMNHVPVATLYQYHEGPQQFASVTPLDHTTSNFNSVQVVQCPRNHTSSINNFTNSVGANQKNIPSHSDSNNLRDGASSLSRCFVNPRFYHKLVKSDNIKKSKIKSSLSTQVKQNCSIQYSKAPDINSRCTSNSVLTTSCTNSIQDTISSDYNNLQKSETIRNVASNSKYVLRNAHTSLASINMQKPPSPASAVYVSKTKLVRASQETIQRSTILHKMDSKKVYNRKFYQKSPPQKMLTLKSRMKIIKNITPKVSPSGTNSCSTSKACHKNSNNPNELKYALLSKRKLIRRRSNSFSNAHIHSKNKKAKALSNVDKSKATHPAKYPSNKSDRFVNIGGVMFKSTATTLKRQLVNGKKSTTANKAGVRPTGFNPKSLRWHHGTAWSKCWHSNKSNSSLFPSLTWVKFNSCAVLSQSILSHKSRSAVINKYKINNSKTVSTQKYKHFKWNNFVEAKQQTIKVQAQQRIIAAAKQRSMQVLRARSSKVWKSNQSNGAFAKYNQSTKSTSATKSTQDKFKSQSKVSYCKFFHRYGRCNRGSNCPYVHNPDRVAICTRFLRGRCHDSGCLFAHIIDKGRMPVCSHFLKEALCIREDCPYLHVNPNKDAPICEDFLHGHCDKREKCELQHILECAEYRELRRCPRQNRCPLPHPKIRCRNKKRTAQSSLAARETSVNKKTDKKTKRRKEKFVSSSVLGDEVDERAIKKLQRSLKTNKVDENVGRYFQDRVKYPVNKKRDSIAQQDSAVNDQGRAVNEQDGAASSDVDASQQSLVCKRERIMKLVTKMKKFNATLSEAEEYSVSRKSSNVHKPGARQHSSLDGKYNIIDDHDTIKVQPLPQLSLTDGEGVLLDYIPLVHLSD